MLLSHELVQNYRISGIMRRRKVLQIAFFTIVREKTFMIQAISYIKILTKIKSARKHSQMLPDLRNSRTFSSADDSQYKVYNFIVSKSFLSSSSS